MTTRLGIPGGLPPQAGTQPAAPGTTASTIRGWLLSSGSETRLNDGDYVVGRDLKAEIRVHDLAVSRRHARISVTGEVVTIEDLGSKNGTWINGNRLEGLRALQDGDHLRVGGVQWVFTRSLEEAPTQTFHRPPALSEPDEEVI